MILLYLSNFKLKQLLQYQAKWFTFQVILSLCASSACLFFVISSKRFSNSLTVLPIDLNIKFYSRGGIYDQPNTNRIYFHETSKRARLNVRQSCAVESAAKHNPDKAVQLFMLHANDFDFSSPWYRVLSQYRNIDIVLVKEGDYFRNTPLEGWFNKGEWLSSPFRIAHFSDYMRMLSAIKGGGLYLDMDILTLRHYDSSLMESDFFVVEDSYARVICNSVFFLNHTHRFTHEIISQLVEEYQPGAWSFHGNDIIIALMKDFCGFKKRKLPIRNNCADIKLLNYDTFFGLSPYESYLMFKPATNYSLSLFAKSYGVHVWNSKSRHEFLDLTSNQLYSILAREHCPMTVKQATNCPFEHNQI